MNKITLNNGIDMPMLGFETFLLSGQECRRSVFTALENGCRMIDTAEAYGNEKEVGDAVRESGIPREDLFLVTKVNFRSYEHTREAVETSLENLQTTYLDLVLLHWPFGNYYAAWRELEKLYKEGKLRAIGVSNFDSDRLIDLIEFNEIVPVVDQIETHLLCQRREEHKWLEKYSVRHMAYAPLGQGHKNEMFGNLALVETARAHHKTPAQTALRFLMQSLNPIKVSSLSSGATQAQLKAAGINTNSAQYKAAVKEMTKHAGSAAMFTNVQAIKNLMSQYDKDGDYIDPTTGLAGLLLTDENRASSKRIISIPESSREEMFQMVKKEFLRENGVLNGDTTKRSDVYTNLYRQMDKKDRLAAGYTMQQYERQYRQALIAAAKSADPNWKIGQSIKSGALDSITREMVETNNVSSQITKKAVDIKI